MLGGLISSCGSFELWPHHLSAVIGVSILLEVCCVHPSGAPHRGEALAQQDTNHNIACFHPRAEKEKQTDNCARLLTQRAGGNSLKSWEQLPRRPLLSSVTA